VVFTPNKPRNSPIATSFTNGDVTRNENVTPSGIPPRTNPIKSGTDEQEQKGVTVPNKALKMLAVIPLNLLKIRFVLSGGK